MANLNKATVGGDSGTWGQKTNDALDALNAELIGTTTKANAAYVKPAGGIPITDLTADAVTVVFRVPVNGVFQVRGSTSTNLRVIWLRAATTDPAVPIGGPNGAIVGHDIILQP